MEDLIGYLLLFMAAGFMTVWVLLPQDMEDNANENR